MLYLWEVRHYTSKYKAPSNNKFEEKSNYVEEKGQ